jgi:hypothetical protein
MIHLSDNIIGGYIYKKMILITYSKLKHKKEHYYDLLLAKEG